VENGSAERHVDHCRYSQRKTRGSSTKQQQETELNGVKWSAANAPLKSDKEELK